MVKNIGRTKKQRKKKRDREQIGFLQFSVWLSKIDYLWYARDYNWVCHNYLLVDSLMCAEWLDGVYILHQHHPFDGLRISKWKACNKFLHCMNMTVTLTDTPLRLVDLVFREYINKACEMVLRSGMVRRNVLSAQASKINNELKVDRVLSLKYVYIKLLLEERAVCIPECFSEFFALSIWEL